MWMGSLRVGSVVLTTRRHLRLQACTSLLTRFAQVSPRRTPRTFSRMRERLAFRSPAWDTAPGGWTHSRTCQTYCARCGRGWGPARRAPTPRVSGSERATVHVVTPLLGRPAVHRINFDGISRAGRQSLARIGDGVMIAADAVRDAPPIAKVFAVGAVIIVTSVLVLDSGTSTKRIVALKRTLHVGVTQTRPAPHETAPTLAPPIVPSPASPTPAHPIHSTRARKQLPPKSRRRRRAAQHASATPAAPQAAPQVTPEVSSQITPQVASPAAATPGSEAAPPGPPAQSYTPPRPAPVTHAPRRSRSSSEFGFER